MKARIEEFERAAKREDGAHERESTVHRIMAAQAGQIPTDGWTRDPFGIDLPAPKTLRPRFEGLVRKQFGPSFGGDMSIELVDGQVTALHTWMCTRSFLRWDKELSADADGAL